MTTVKTEAPEESAPERMKEAEAANAVDSLLKDAPQFKPVTQFTSLDRQAINRVKYRLLAAVGTGGLDGLDPADPQLGQFLADLEVEAEPFFRRIALDPAEFDQWTIGLKDAELKYLYLVMGYIRDLGE